MMPPFGGTCDDVTFATMPGMHTVDDATLEILAAQATDPDHEPQDRADAAAVLAELVAGDVWAVERIAAALARIRQRRAVAHQSGAHRVIVYPVTPEGLQIATYGPPECGTYEPPRPYPMTRTDRPAEP